jgi:hypothetical protein
VPSGLTGTEIASDLVDRHRSLGAFGKPAWQSHVPLRALIRQRLGERYANFFAVPNLESGLLRWTTEASGPVRSWQSLDPQERALRAFDVEEIRGRLFSLEQDLSRRGGTDVSGASSFAALLKQARCVPSHEGFIYMVGDQPVVAFWGFETRAPEVPMAAASETALSPAALPVPGSAAAYTFGTVPQTVAVEAAARPWWRWLRWLLGLLLLLLLVLLSLGLLRAFNLPGFPVMPGTVGAVDGGSSGDRSPVARNPGVTGVQGVQADPRAVADQAASAAQDGSPNVPVAPGVHAPPNSDASPPTPATPGTPDGPKAPSAPETRPPLVVPPQASSLGFLKGEWVAQTGLIDRQTRQPLDLSMRFDDQGQGRLRLQRADGSSCDGPLQASRTQTGLIMEAKQALPCSNGGSFESPRIECTPLRDGRTDCFGWNPDGSRFGMEVRRR